MQNVRNSKRNKKLKCRHDNYKLLNNFLNSDFECIMVDYHDYANMKSCIESLRASIKRFKYGNLISIHQCEDRVYITKGRML